MEQIEMTWFDVIVDHYRVIKTGNVLTDTIVNLMQASKIEEVVFCKMNSAQKDPITKTLFSAN